MITIITITIFFNFNLIYTVDVKQSELFTYKLALRKNKVLV